MHMLHAPVSIMAHHHHMLPPTHPTPHPHSHQASLHERQVGVMQLLAVAQQQS